MSKKNSEVENESHVHIGCGCLSDVVAIILFAILCDLMGCSWSHGICDKISNMIHGNPQVQEMCPSDLR